MKDILSKLNKAFENRLRLGIMSVLIANEQADFLFLKEHLKATDGNLASHTNSLEKLGYLSIEKKFVGKKPKTIFHLTEEGRKAFTDHLNALEELIKNPYK